jgi:MFS family permease
MAFSRDQKNFYFLVAARSMISLGTQAQAVAVAWYVYELTKDPLYLGLIGLCEFIPALLLAPFAGTIVDRKSRSILYRNAILLSSLVPIGLVIIASQKFQSVPSFTRVHSILLLMGVSGVARAFLSPAGVALTGEIVPRGKMVKASAWITSAWQLSTVLGPAAGGFAYSFGKAISAFYLSLFFQILAVLFSTLILSQNVKPIVSKSDRESFIAGTKRAWKFLRGEPRLFAAVLLDMLAVLFGGAVALLPIFAEKLGAGSVGLGFLRAAPAMGSLVMAMVLVRRPPSKQSGKWLLISVAGFGVSTIVFAFSRSFALSLAALFFTGLFDAVSVIVRGTLLQLLTPDSIKGRVSSLNSIFINSSNELGAFESGVTAKIFGAVNAAALGGLLTIGVVAWAIFKFPTLRTTSLSEMEKQTS